MWRPAAIKGPLNSLESLPLKRCLSLAQESFLAESIYMAAILDGQALALSYIA
jgi:hypothetical protein